MLNGDLQLLSNHGVHLAAQVLAAILAGGMLGYERQRLSKPVGILTAVLVTLGATIIVMAGNLLSESTGGDPTRLPSMIVSGIGFIGAGAIIRSRFRVSGLASAATIWVLGALGVLIGSGHPLLALSLALVLLLLLRLIPKLEHMLFSKRACLHMSLGVRKEKLEQLQEYLSENQVTYQTRPSTGDRSILSINECGVEHRNEFLRELRKFEGLLDLTPDP
jgi:uncharacterized membrane protein YhiD involved in acid resistance